MVVFSQPAPVLVLPPETTALIETPPVPDVEQLQAVDAVFAQDPDTSTAACLLGLWSGAMVMSDLVQGHLRHEEKEVEESEDEEDHLPGEE